MRSIFVRRFYNVESVIKSVSEISKIFKPDSVWAFLCLMFVMRIKRI